jgi:hypothetical protein
MEKKKGFFSPKINLFCLWIQFLKFLHDLLFSYEIKIIQILACDNYDGFQHLSFIYSEKKWFHETDPRGSSFSSGFFIWEFLEMLKLFFLKISTFLKII